MFFSVVCDWFLHGVVEFIWVRIKFLARYCHASCPLGFLIIEIYDIIGTEEHQHINVHIPVHTQTGYLDKLGIF